MKLTFLLGSGISIPARLPTVEKLTNAVLSGSGIMEANRSAAGHSFPDSTRTHERDAGIHRRAFLRWLNAQALVRYAENPHRRVNYEDLAYLAGQIADDIRGEYENPAIYPFVSKALIELKDILNDLTPAKAREQLGQLAKTTLEYICQTIESLLQKDVTQDFSYLSFFKEACCDDAVDAVNFFTLNHDTLIEDFLSNNLNRETYRVIDGTVSGPDGSRRWDPHIYDQNEAGRKLVKVYKLHGDIHGQPPILVGTFNKIFRYNSSEYLELHYRFKRALLDDDCPVLIVCGYGFGDKGVNTRIVEWIKQWPENRLLIIDPKESKEVHGSARGAIQHVINRITYPKTTTQDDDADPSRLNELADHLLCGNYLVKHFKGAIGNPDSKDYRAVTWEDVHQCITITDAEFQTSAE
jgi:hypothetical protein